MHKISYLMFSFYLVCDYVPMDGPVKARGKTVRSHKNVEDFETCTKFCDENSKCKSFLHDSKKKNCILKDLLLTGSEPIVKKNKIFYSVYKICDKGTKSSLMFRSRAF